MIKFLKSLLRQFSKIRVLSVAEPIGFPLSKS